MLLFARKSGTVGDPRLAQGPTAVIIAHSRRDGEPAASPSHRPTTAIFRAMAPMVHIS